MKPDAPEPTWHVRPPWSDEGDRLPAALLEPLNRRGARRHWIWLLVAGEFERIVGGVTLAERDPAAGGARSDGQIDFTLLPAWQGAVDPVEALLVAAVGHATSLGLAPVEIQASPATPAGNWLGRQGFVPTREHEVWRVPFSSNYARRAAAIERSLVRRPLAVRPLDEAALPAVRAICAGYGLLSPARVMLARDGREGLDPRLSFIAGTPEAPTAILLARSAGPQVYLEVLARAPGQPGQGPEIGALLHAFFRAAQGLGATETICLFDTAHAHDTARLLTRADAERIDRFALFRREAG